MKILTSLQEASQVTPLGSVATIGNFDGVHQGHQQLIHAMVKKAEEAGLPSVVITFSPHPERLFTPLNAPPLIMPENAKYQAIGTLGADYVLVLPFTLELAALSPLEFVNTVLCQGIATKHLFVGHDYAFGKGRQGNASLLEELGKQLGFSLTQHAPVYLLGDIVSSTRIRKLVQNGQTAEAASLLGRPFFLEGIVGHGKKRGGDALGFPTANLSSDASTLLPKSGVYAVRVALKEGVAPLPLTPHGGTLSGVTNVGANPTFGDVPLGVETHLLDFNKDIYHTAMRVWFMSRLRDEQTFASVNDLIQQITKDTSMARALL